jgi:uncharacterized protein (TIGR02118 family)
MPAAKLVVTYPIPRDVDAFERAYRDQHLPLAAPVFKAAGATKVVLTKIEGAAAGKPPIHRMAEIHFKSLDDLQACAASDDGRKVVADAHAISNGGAPTILIATEDVVTF